jgi:hypothetical protein
MRRDVRFQVELGAALMTVSVLKRMAEWEGKRPDSLRVSGWQSGTRHYRKSHDFDCSIETAEPFVNVWEAYGEYYASPIDGDSFRLDLANGLATYSGWARP